MLSLASASKREAGQLFLWLPVALAAGIGAYFSLPREPPAAVVVLAALALAALLYAGWRRQPSAVADLLAAALAGFLLAKLDAVVSGTPLVASVSEPLRFQGVIEDIDRRGRRSAALTVRHHRAGRAAAGRAAEADQAHRPLARRFERRKTCRRQHPAVSASDPGGARAPTITPAAQWLRGIGASGRACDPLEVDEPALRRLRSRCEAPDRVAATRRSASVSAAVLPGSVGAFATALVSGDRGDIPASTNASLQASGLAHIISISGLHMSLVAGGFFWIVRALLALSPALAVNWPIKKWAAAGALAVGAFYLVLSGGEVPTQRSYIMLAIMFGAVLADRPALSMRNVAVAALIILAVEPASALDAGFQMSFLAVAGLVSFYEAARDRRWFDPASGIAVEPCLPDGRAAWPPASSLPLRHR